MATDDGRCEGLDADDDLEEVHFVNLGTPTVSLNRRGQNRLSLSKRSSEVRNQSATVTRSEQSPAKTSSQARVLGQSTFQNNLPVTMPDQISTEHGTLVMRQDHSPTHQSTPLSRPDKSPSKKCAPVLVPGLNQIEQSIPETSSDLIPHQGSSRQRTLDLPDIPEPQGILITGTAYESQCNLYDTNMSSGISSNDIDVADSDNDPDLIAAVKASIE
ncbi:uncharacterized protein LOC128548330 [Mercenaria mercenaria]|uniref:uncharacterized protein LOC128548330 n=1 Tax=Mercenaria mercenaria TaxID=6596 RepID=UPI00234F05FE|nr:uncharacterized protein LOC128548330 [Mercenaria mercenaria]